MGIKTKPAHLIFFGDRVKYILPDLAYGQFFALFQAQFNILKQRNACVSVTSSLKNSRSPFQSTYHIFINIGLVMAKLKDFKFFEVSIFNVQLLSGSLWGRLGYAGCP